MGSCPEAPQGLCDRDGQEGGTSLRAFISASDGESQALGERIGKSLHPGSVLALRGGLAAGKTTLTKGIAKGLGISEEVTSPSYTLISEYPGKLNLYHMDAYRLSTPEEFLDLGVEELLYGKGVCVVEWSERVGEVLPEDSALISIEVLPDGRRRISIESRELEEALL